MEHTLHAANSAHTAIAIKTSALSSLVQSDHAVHALGCGGVPDGIHANIDANSISHGISTHGDVSYGSTHFSVSGQGSLTHIGNNGYSSNSITYGGTTYFCPNGEHGNVYSVGVGGTHSSSNSYGFNAGVSFR